MTEIFSKIDKKVFYINSDRKIQFLKLRVMSKISKMICISTRSTTNKLLFLHDYQGISTL